MLCDYVLELLAQTGDTDVPLAKINVIKLYDQNGNIIASVSPKSITSSNQSITVDAEYMPERDVILSKIIIGSYLNGWFRDYFIDDRVNGVQIPAYSVFSYSFTASLAHVDNFTCPSVFSQCSHDFSGLIDIILSALEGSYYPSKSGKYVRSMVVGKELSGSIVESVELDTTINQVPDGVIITAQPPNTLNANFIALKDYDENIIAKFKNNKIVVIPPLPISIKVTCQ